MGKVLFLVREGILYPAMALYTLPEPSAEMRSNFFHLYFDILWFGVLAGSTLAFLAIYAARIGANTLQLGLLSAVPAVVNLFFSLPAGRWLENQPLIRSTYWSSIGQRLFYLVLVILPLIFNDSQQIWSIVWIVLIMSVPGTLLAISFNALFADSVPPEYRAEVVGRRNAILALSTTVSALLCGQILDKIPFPTCYQIVFFIGAAGSLISSYHLRKIKSPVEPPVRVWRPLGDFAFPGVFRLQDGLRQTIELRFLTRSRGKPLLRMDLLRGPFGIFMGAYLIFYISQNFPLPLFPIYFVHNLGLKDSVISLGNGLFYVSMMAGSLYIPRITSRMGHRNVLIIGAVLFGGYPLILFLAHDATLYWVANIFGGIVWAVLNAGLVNRLMERVPEDDRPAHMALHNLSLNLGILLGSMLAPVLATWIGVREALLVAGVMRLLAAGLLIFCG